MLDTLAGVADVLTQQVQTPIILAVDQLQAHVLDLQPIYIIQVHWDKDVLHVLEYPIVLAVLQYILAQQVVIAVLTLLKLIIIKVVQHQQHHLQLIQTIL